MVDELRRVYKRAHSRQSPILRPTEGPAQPEVWEETLAPVSLAFLKQRMEAMAQMLGRLYEMNANQASLDHTTINAREARMAFG